jgi:hypothetical protein
MRKFLFIQGDHGAGRKRKRGTFLALRWGEGRKKKANQASLLLRRKIAGKPSVVVGVVIDVAYHGEGGKKVKASPFFEAALSKAGQIPDGGDRTHTGPLDSAEIEAHVRHSDVYQYPGSLTTPPCGEGIAWNVVAEPAYVSAETYEKAKRVMKFNSRYTQNAPGEINLLQNAAMTVPV